jgi:limonene-1,2-epoxide hydrolase
VLAVATVGSGAALAAGQTASPAQVVRAWSKALNANDNAAAAALFAPNARVVQPGVDVVLTSRMLATEFNAALPCAGRIIALTVHGTRAVATFVLGHRPQHRCDGPGVRAAALFVVRNGRIVLWRQVAVPNPDAGKPTA